MMKFQLKKMFLENSATRLSLIGLVVFTFGCEPPAPTTNGNTTVVNTAAVNNAPVNTNTAIQPKKESASKMSVTLPALDAMFSDEEFAGELKSKVQLTDEQIVKLKKISRDAVSDLNEEETENASTRASIERADKQIRETLGEEKSAAFFDFLQQKWAGESDSANTGNSKPNSVPTDTRVVVNAPAYRMDVFQEGKLVKSYKIGIGYPEFPLPSGTRKAETIIFNPTWTPPDEPWVKGKVEAGKTVEAGSKLNPLGPIKIPIGSPSLIHGGKSPARLGNFASHGCVGLTNPQVQDFALELAKLSGLQLTAVDVKNYEKQKTETKNVKLDKSIPVELRYETIVVEDGKLKIFRDVYERGTNTEENLRRVLEGYGVTLDNLNEADRAKILQGLSQMAIDATGNPVDANANTQTNVQNNTQPNGNQKSSTGGNSKNANAASNSGSVTRNVKGKKELVFEIAELKGKGYPAAVGLVSK